MGKIEKILAKYVDENTELDDLLWIEENRIVAINETTLSQVFQDLNMGNPTIHINRIHPGYHEFSVEIPEWMVE